MIRFDKSGVFHDKAVTQKILRKLNVLLDDGKREMRVMHVCGTHEHVIAEYGIRSILPPNIDVISGPGCPVCVCHTLDIHKALMLAENGHVIATFGDMVRVPSETGSLGDAKARGLDIKIVYAIEDAIHLAKQNPEKEVIFFFFFFETFVPVVASSIISPQIPKNLSFLCSLKTITPIMELLLSLGNIVLDGFITPGHVSAIIGTKPYGLFSSAYNMPIVTAGFQPNDILLALLMLANQINDGEARNENEYKGVVKAGGNTKALAIISKVFEETKVFWRGIGPVPNGGFKIRDEFANRDANVKFSLDERIQDEDIGKNKGIPLGCSCHLVIMGQMKPDGCALFRSGKCHPQNPVGPCMVSEEGTCRIAHYFKE